MAGAGAGTGTHVKFAPPVLQSTCDSCQVLLICEADAPNPRWLGTADWFMWDEDEEEWVPRRMAVKWWAETEDGDEEQDDEGDSSIQSGLQVLSPTTFCFA